MTKKMTKTPKTSGAHVKATPAQEAVQIFELRNRHVLGTMDALTKRIKSSVELLEKRVEYLALVYEDDTRALERFKEVSDEDWVNTVDSIEAIHMEYATEYVNEVSKVIESLNKVHKILNKRKN